MIIHITLLLLMFLSSLWTVLAKRLIESAIGLGLTSVILTTIMFQLDTQLAGVFELIVCSGLISVVFVTTIGLTNPVTYEESIKRGLDRFKRFVWLPIVLLLVEVFLFSFKIPFDFPIAQPDRETNVKNLLWNVRHLDLFGQLILLFIGVFGVISLFKEKSKSE
ncbi:MAG: NADH-quinone oxidoreductase subunit J [Candidatus Riflebacteria bacterium]|nr:NADH-quinone oxidoreductase subunit J [Candidatus Riflebacteria bacterium]